MNGKIYYRGTNNFNELTLIKNKSIKHSRNHLTNKLEKGLSVSDTPDILFNYFSIVYKIKGKEIDIGADGEPILDINTLELFVTDKPNINKESNDKILELDNKKTIIDNW